MRLAALAGWYAVCLMLALPWWLLVRPSWTLFILAALMLLVALAPGPELRQRRRGAFLWFLATLVFAVASAGLALP